MSAERVTDWTVFVGRKINMITINNLSGKDRHGNQMFDCTCDCGKHFIAIATAVNKERVRSCGCLQRNTASKMATTHGQSKTRLYSIWNAMRTRCRNANTNRSTCYKRKGVKVCDEWDNFSNFYEWSIRNGYNDKLSIDRIDNNGNYSPENCRWTTNKIQMNNTSRNRFIEYHGKRKTVSEWADFLGVNYKYFHQKLKENDWDISKVMQLPYYSEVKGCV